jgi:ABC-type thiamin/hydroxymethylpyrimidine transport system permease subunit
MSAPTRRYFSIFELVLLAMLAALIVASHVGLKLPLKLPGHSGIVWMALLVVARQIVPKPGAAVTAGVLSGAVAMFLGVGDKGALDTLLSYAAAGVGVDAVATLTGGGAGLWASALAGLAGNLSKLAVKIALEVWIGIPTGFVLIGRLYPAFTHTAFGLAGGVLGGLVVEALRRAGYFAYLAEKR